MNPDRATIENNGGPSSTGTSRSLLARIQADEPEAWERLVRLYSPLVLHWCRGRGMQNQDVADVFQEVFQAVVAHVAGFRRDRQGDTFRGWLRRITQNKLNDRLRRLGREVPGVGGSSALDRLAQLPERASAAELPTADEAEFGLLARVLDMIRAEFEARTWTAFWQTAVDGRDTRDVAADLSMTSGAVRVAKARVLRRLRQELGDLNE